MNYDVVAKICKVDVEQRLVCGPVLIPGKYDAQDDIITPEEIAKAAHRFLANYNNGSKLGDMHKSFPDGKLELVESFVVPEGNTIVIGDHTYVYGTWLIVVKVLDDEIWDRVKDGRLNGFSIGGTARPYPVEAETLAEAA